MKKILTLLCAALFAVGGYAAPGEATRGADGRMWKTDSAAKVIVGVDTLQAVVEVAVDTVHAVETHDGPLLDFGDTTEVDFGQIEEKGGKQLREFVFKNSGNKPLVVTKTVVSCKCMDIAYPKKPVLPGSEGKITVTYNPRKQSGVFYKAIQVYSNDPQTRRVIFVKGEVVE